MRKPIQILLLPLFFSFNVTAEETPLFEDDFERSEADPQKENVGEGWNTNSSYRANGNKQASLIDGRLRVVTHPTADHAASVKRPLGFTDGMIEMDFMLPSVKDSIGINIADTNRKDLHAGHLAMIQFYTDKVHIEDMAGWRMNKTIRGERFQKQPKTEAEKAEAAPFKVQEDLRRDIEGKWSRLKVVFEGDQVTAFVNGKKVLSLTSPGLSHPDKSQLRLHIPNEVFIDNVTLTRTKQD